MPTSQGTLNSKAIQHKKFILSLICLALAILTVVTFWQLKDFGFVNLDDNAYVYENVYVQSGLNWNNILQAFSLKLSEKSGHWCPLTWLSFMLDYQIFGLNPQGFHVVNLLFHVMNTILLFLILRRMTKTIWPSAFVAALFAIHPLHVESVAWITERKDVLSTFFWMLTMGAYSYYVEHPGWWRYLFVVVFFALGLMAKSMLITLPFVLLLLDYWPLRRFQETTPDHKVKEETGDFQYQWSKIYSLLKEKIPLFILIILSGIITYLAAQNARTVISIESISPIGRIENAFISYVTYMGKMIWPVNLAVFYPHPQGVILWQVFGSVFLLIAITLVVIWKAKRFPYLATGWLWYVGTLVPVIGIVQAGSQAMADRYTYIPLIGIFIMVAWGIPELLAKWKYRKEIFLASSALIILFLSIITWKQVGYWQDSIPLLSHTLEVTNNNSLCYLFRGYSYHKLGNYRQAIEDFDRAIEIKPDLADAYYNRGNAYGLLGYYRRAIKDFDRAIEINPRWAMVYFNRGLAYNMLGDRKLAFEDLKTAAKLGDERAKNFLRSHGISW